MKKLLAMLSAAATAFGLQAADPFPSGTNFDAADWPDETEKALWTSLDGLSVTNAPYTYEGLLPVQFQDDAAGSNLAIDRKLTDATFRNIVSGGEAQAIPDAGLVVDTLIKFTAFDPEEAADLTDTNAKLAVWVREVESEDDTASPTYQLMVTAGKWDSSTEYMVATNYACSSKITDIDAWYRLTVKAIGDITNGGGKPGYVVCVNGEAVSSAEAKADVAALDLTTEGLQWAENGTLFPGLILDNKTISAVGFAGKGWVDDLSVTDQIPDFIATKPVFTIIGNDKVKSFTYNGKTWKTGEKALFAVADGSSPDSVTDIEYVEGYFGPTTMTVSKTENTVNTVGTEAKLEAASVTIDGTKTQYATIADAVAAINEAAASATLKLGADVTGSITIDNSNSGAAIVIDLAGKTVTQGTGEDDLAAIYVSNGAVTVQDSVGTGVLKAKDGTAAEDGAYALLLTGGSGVLEGGTYDGTVLFQDATLAIRSTAVKILASANGETLTDATLPEGMKLVEGTDGYLSLAEPPSWKSLLGEANAAGVYEIDNEAELAAFAENVGVIDTKDVSFALTANIALTVPEDGSASTQGFGIRNAKDWAQKSDYATATPGYPTFVAGAFQGTFDGAGYTIANVILPRTDYAGLFMATYGATIKNLKVSLGNATGFATATTIADGESASGYGGGVIVGVAVRTTVEDCETVVAGDYRAFTSAKGMGGIAGWAGSGTVLKGCVNNLDVTSTGNEKVGGLVACPQDSDNVDEQYKTGLVIDGCTNNGAVVGPSGKKLAAGLVPSSFCTVTFKGTCAQNGTVSGSSQNFSIATSYGQQAGRFVVDDGAVITTTQANQLAVNYGSADGLAFATVAGDTATFVKAADIKADGSYKVMASGAAYTMATLGSVTFDTSLATVTVTKGTDFADERYTLTEAKDATTETLITYTLADTSAPAYTPVDPETPTACDSEDAANAMAAAINASKATLINAPEGLTDDQKTAYRDLFTATVSSATSEGTTTYSVTVALTESATETIQAQVDGDVKTLEVATVAAAESDTKQTLTTTPGIYYSVVAGATLDGMEVRSSTMATGDTLEVTLPKYEGAGFYRIKATVKAQEVVAK